MAAPLGDLTTGPWFEQVFRACYAELCTYVRRYVGSSDVSEDVVQDLFVAVWREQQYWKRKGDGLLPALYLAARRRAYDAIKHRRVRERYLSREASRRQGAHVEAEAEDAAVHRNLQDIAEAAIMTLPRRRREIFMLHREEGLTYAEIADRLGLSKKTVETQMSRALSVLRSELAFYLASFLAALIVK